MKKSIIAFVATLFIFYLLGSFVSISFNIAYWTEFLRGLIAYSGFAISAVMFVIFYNQENQ